LNIHFVDTPLTVFADADRTAQVVVNLLSNAVRYTPEGGSITVATSTAERFAQVQVCDTGQGIALEDQKHIFDRFYRADPSRTRSSGGSGGSGIGLTIARHLVWAMGGKISVDSPGIDRGSTFTLWLPLASQ
jgi:histidine kinase